MVVISLYPDMDNHYILHKDSFLMLAIGKREKRKPFKALTQCLSVHGQLRHKCILFPLPKRPKGMVREIEEFFLVPVHSNRM